MTSGEEAISGLMSETEFSYDEKSKDTTEGGSSRTRGRKRLKTGSDVNTESDGDLLQSAGERDGTETDEFTTESSVQRKRKRVRKSRDEHIQGYLDMEASLDDEEERDGRYSNELEMSKEDHDKYMTALYGRRSKKADFFERLQREDPESLGQLYEDTEDIDGEEYEEAENVHLSLLPSLKDPKLFSVKCRGGSEKETAVSLMIKMMSLKGTKNELNIFSASALDKFPCHIFIEAHRDFHVKEAIKGLKNLNINTVRIIPVKEVTQVFMPDPTKQPSLEVGQFVRLKKGLYGGDLGMVLDFDDGYRRIKIKLVPRLLSGTMRDELDDLDKENAAKKIKKMRPPKRFFSPEEFHDAKPLDSKRRGSQVWAYDNKRFENGMLVKTLWLKNLLTENVIPSLEEVEMFKKAEPTNEAREEIMERAKKTIEESKKFVQNLEKGDKVQIIQGDLKGLTGIVTEVTEGQVKVLPDVNMLDEPVLYMPNEIVKVFKVGDHVEILNGKFKGITGNIIKVDENVAHIISEDNKEEMQVLLNDIKYTANINVATHGKRKRQKNNAIQKHDLVILSDNRTVGVIISVLMNKVVMVDTDGYVKTVKKMQILNKLNKGHVKNSYGQDLYGGCIIRVSDGIHKGKMAVVKHVFNNKLFLFDRRAVENSGIFVEHMNNCYLLGANIYDNTRMMARFNNPVLKRAQEEQMLSAQNPLEEKTTQVRRQDPKSRRIGLIGKIHTVTKGMYKGYTGQIQSLTENKVRIELQAKNKCITIPLDHLNIDAAERESYSTNRMTGKTPMYKGANSPFYINTPAYNPE